MNAVLPLTRPSRPVPASGADLARLLPEVFDDPDGDLDQERSSLSSTLGFMDGDATAVGPPRPGLARWQARKIEALIEANLETGLRVTKLADSIELSRTHFTRAFKEHFGCCPQRYILERRISRAQRLMLAGDCRLCDVAQACGFSDQAHLSRIFLRLAGATPNAWRRACLSAERRREQYQAF